MSTMNNNSLEIILDTTFDCGLTYLTIREENYIREFIFDERYDFLKEQWGNVFTDSIEFFKQVGDFYLIIRKAFQPDFHPMKYQFSTPTLLAERGRVFRSYEELNDYLTAVNLFNEMISNACFIDITTRRLAEGKTYEPIPVFPTEDGEMFGMYDPNEDNREEIQKLFEEAKKEIIENHLGILETIPAFKSKYSILLDMDIEQICEYFRNEPKNIFKTILSLS